MVLCVEGVWGAVVGGWMRREWGAGQGVVHVVCVVEGVCGAGVYGGV